MPRRTHYARLQRLETASGVCQCRRALVLTCLKAMEAQERGEVETAEPCPAGCAPEARLVVAMQLSVWRKDGECTCPSCTPGRQRRATVPETVAKPPLALPKPVDVSPGTDGPQGQPEAARAQAPAAGFLPALVEAVPEPPAREQVVEVRRARVSVPVGGPTPRLGPEDVVGGPGPHGPCGLPFCRHALQSHRCYTERLPCRYCGWTVHEHLGIEPLLPYAARRLWPCGTYLSIAFEGGEHDGCTVEGCGCPGWRLKAPYMTDRDVAFWACRAEQERTIARNKEELARLQTRCEQLQRDVLRAQGRIDNGPAPRGAPVYVEGGGR